MAKIIYGVAGQGFGHSARSKEILGFLAKQGHQILVFTYDQGLFLLSHPSSGWEVFEIPGLNLSYKDNRLRYWHTFYSNAKKVFLKVDNWPRILTRFRDFKPDLVITDFEPLSALLAKWQRVPLISLDNQHQLTHTDIDLPKEYEKDLLLDKLVVKSMVWKANYYLITSFFETPVKKKNAFLFSPIIRQEVLALEPKKEDYILVYQTSSFSQVIEELKGIDQRFVVFGLNMEKTVGNIEFKNYSHHDWLKYLANCRAIIGNAGLSLISESLYLKKPYLALPVAKQIEQIINAYYLEKMGYGRMTKEFNRSVFEDFLDHLPDYEKNLASYGRCGNGEISKKLEELIKKLVK